MSDLAAFAWLSGCVFLGAVIAGFISDWIGARRFSKRVDQLEKDAENNRRLVGFIVTVMEHEKLVTIDRPKEVTPDD